MSLNLSVENIIKKEIQTVIIDKAISHRAVGDIIESVCSVAVSKHFKDFSKSTSKRSVEDFTIKEENIFNLFDVKGHHIQDKNNGFSMPNLVSIRRLKKIFNNPNKTINYIFVHYKRDEDSIEVKEVKVLNIYEIAWSNLTIGALGYGQLQIKDNNKNIETIPPNKESWELNLKKMATNFYIKQITKFEKQIKIWNA